MTATSTPPVAGEARPRRPVALVAGIAGELLVTLGVVGLLFVAWQVWWTDVLAHRAHEATREQLISEWGIDRTTGRTPPVAQAQVGRAFGLLYVPAMRDGAWGVPIFEGTGDEQLDAGVAHHVSSAMPGTVGNLAIAGHRTSYGAPFGEIDALHAGDEVIVETRNGWYVYELDRSVIVDGDDGWILDPVPGKPDTVPTEALITIYGCHPKYSAAQRFVWFGHLVDAYAKSYATPAEIERYGRTS